MSRLTHRTWRATMTATALGASLAGCMVGPNYQRPDAPITPTFKEAAGWTPSHPVDALDKGAWWSMYNDPDLDRLEAQVATANQTVKQYEAVYREAHDIVAEARSTLFPTVTAVGHAERSKAGSTTSSSGVTTSSPPSNSFEAALEATWVPDLWGKVRRTIESDKALAQASAADLANAELAAQASLAEDYFQLRTLDEEKRLLTDTVDGYQKLVKLTQDQVREGTQPQSAILTAQTQLYGAQAQLIAVGVARSQMEHAVAVLTGVSPAALTIAPKAYVRDVPTPPLTVPSTLLERRPDIAAAERRMASGNALIGVAVSAYYPDVTLSGDVGTSASSIGRLFSASSTLWSLGADATETLLDFGQRQAQVRASKAVYDEDVAVYRQTVLTAFQGIEDQLAALRIYQQQEEVLLLTEQAAKQTVKIDLQEYREGTIDYTTVISAQATQLQASINVLTVIQNRLNASVLLVENLGGGWTAADLPKG